PPDRRNSVHPPAQPIVQCTVVPSPAGVAAAVVVPRPALRRGGHLPAYLGSCQLCPSPAWPPFRSSTSDGQSEEVVCRACRRGPAPSPTLLPTAEQWRITRPLPSVSCVGRHRRTRLSSFLSAASL